MKHKPEFYLGSKVKIIRGIWRNERGDIIGWAPIEQKFIILMFHWGQNIRLLLKSGALRIITQEIYEKTSPIELDI